MFAAVEFPGRRGSTEVSVVPTLWLTDNNTYCYWPRNVKNDAAFIELVKQQAIYQKGWSKHKVHKVLRTSEEYQDVEDYACDLIGGGTTDDSGQAIEVIRKPIISDKNRGGNDSAGGKENVDPQDDRHRKSKKRDQKQGKGIKRTRRNNSSSPENSGDSTWSSSQNSESSCISNADSSPDGRHCKKKLSKRQKLNTHRRADEVSEDKSGSSNFGNSRSTVSKKTSSDDRPDFSAHGGEHVSHQKSPALNNRSPATLKESTTNVDSLEQQRPESSNRHRSITPQSSRSNGTSRDKQQSGGSKPQRSATRDRSIQNVNGLERQESPKSYRHPSATPTSSRSNDTGRDMFGQRRNTDERDSLPRQIFQASPETHRKIFGSGVPQPDDIRDDLWFRRKVLNYLEGSKSLFEQICHVLTQVLQTTQANLLGTERPKQIPDLPIADIHTFELFDQMLVDPVVKGYMKNRLMSIGGETVRAVAMGMMRGVITDLLATQYNWAGHNDKKKFETTNFQGLICESAKQALRKKVKATDKEIKDAMKDWLKQSGNRIKGRAKTTTTHPIL